MSHLLEPDTADLTLLQDRQVAVLGYDALAAAHALNLRDSGVDVRIGIDPDSRGAARAEMDGLAVTTAEAAVAACDIVLVATEPGIGLAERDLAATQRLLEEHTEPGDLVIVTSGETVRHANLTVPDGVDLAMIRAMAAGDRVRTEYLDGRGCPALVAVVRDDSGAAWPTLTAYAAAMGSLRSGAVVTTLEREADATRFADIAVHCTVQRIVENAFDVLVTHGIEAEVAYVVTLHELKARVDEVYAAGYATQHGPTGQSQRAGAAVDLVPDLSERMAELLEQIRSGQAPVAAGVAGEGQPESQDDGIPSSRRAAAEAAHPLERVGRRVRAMMSWIR